MFRHIALVTLQPDADVAAVVALAAAVIAQDPNCIWGEVGQSLGLGQGSVPRECYAVLITFPDRQAYERYARGPAHREFASSVRAQIESVVVAQYEVDG